MNKFSFFLLFIFISSNTYSEIDKAFKKSCISKIENILLLNIDKLRKIENEIKSILPGETIYFKSKTSKDGFFRFEAFQQVLSEENNEEMGEILFKYFPTRKKIFIDTIYVEEKFRNMKLSLYFKLKVLNKYPKTEIISSNLGLDNFNAFEKHFQITNDIEKSLKATPAYKALKKIGYSKIDLAQSEPDFESRSIPLVVLKSNN